jgi:hypothetical protein
MLRSRVLLTLQFHHPAAMPRGVPKNRTIRYSYMGNVFHLDSKKENCHYSGLWLLELSLLGLLASTTHISVFELASGSSVRLLTKAICFPAHTGSLSS